MRRRADDTDEAVTRRLTLYDEQTQPLLDWFARRDRCRGGRRGDQRGSVLPAAGRPAAPDTDGQDRPAGGGQRAGTDGTGGGRRRRGPERRRGRSGHRGTPGKPEQVRVRPRPPRAAPRPAAVLGDRLIRPTTASFRTRWPRTATRWMPWCCWRSRSPAAGSGPGRSGSSGWKTRRARMPRSSASPSGDPRWDQVRDLDDMQAHLRSEIHHFFDVYKALEPGKSTSTTGFEGRQAALGEIAASGRAWSTISGPMRPRARRCCGRRPRPRAAYPWT